MGRRHCLLVAIVAGWPVRRRLFLSAKRIGRVSIPLFAVTGCETLRAGRFGLAAVPPAL